MKSLLLDRTAWDLVIDSSGNIALASNPYALSQNVANVVRLFLGELWYDTTQGVPYFTKVLGYLPPLSLFTQLMQKAALTVTGVATATCVVSSYSDSAITGQIQFTDKSGGNYSVNF